ncbi:MAG: TOBE domain-containing protein [Actinomycetota bacterium]
MGQVAELLGVSGDTVRRWVDAGRLQAERTSGGRRLVEGAELARFVVASAEDHEPEGLLVQSARNHLTGIVTKVVKDGVAAQVEVQAGPFRLVSLMTREAADDLGLEPGMMAVASVKSTNVWIELPRVYGGAGDRAPGPAGTIGD